jgi:DNA repair protein RadA
MVGKKKEENELLQLPGIGEATAEKLIQNGFDTIEKIAVASPFELAEIAEISVDVAKRAIEAAKKMSPTYFETAQQVYERRKQIERTPEKFKTELEVILAEAKRNRV